MCTHIRARADYFIRTRANFRRRIRSFYSTGKNGKREEKIEEETKVFPDAVDKDVCKR